MYTSDEKIPDLDNLPTPDPTDYIPYGDVSDSGRAKKSIFSAFVAAVANYITTTVGGFVNSVTGLDTDNTDPQNPIVKIAVDGVTVMGDGTPGDPLSSVGGGGTGGSGGVKLFIDTTEVSIANGGGGTETTLFTDTVPSGILGTNNAIRGKLYFSTVGQDNSGTLTFRVKYGGSNVATIAIGGGTGAGDITGGPGQLEFYIVADNATGAQKTGATFVAFQASGSLTETNADTAVSIQKILGSTTGTGAIDSNADQALAITAQYSTTAAECDLTAEWIVVEEISDGGDSKKVGVGEINDTQWFNIQYPFVPAGGVSFVGSMWESVGGTTFNGWSQVQLGDGQSVRCNSGGGVSVIFPSFRGVSSALNFNSGKQIIAQQVVYVQVASATENGGGMGFDISGGGGTSIVNMQGTNTTSVGFVRKESDGTWYARTANGASFTETLITISATATHILRIEYDPANATPQARFYVDGVLVATITTTVPSAVATAIGYSFGNAAAAGVDIAITQSSAPSFAVEI